MVMLKRTQLTGYSEEHKRILADLFSYDDQAERVNSQTIFALAGFLRGTKLISDTVARIPRPVFKRQKDGGREKWYDHHCYDLLNNNANPWLTSFNFFQALTSNTCWSGQGYGLIVRDEEYYPSELHVLDSRNTAPIAMYQEGRLVDLVYNYYDGQQNHFFPADDIIHIKSLSLHSGVEGLSIPDACKVTLGLGITVQQFGRYYFKNGSHIKTWAKIPGWLSQEQAEMLKADLENFKAGVRNTNKIAIMQGNSTLESLPVSADEMQWLGSREMNIVDCANILGLPASKLNLRGSQGYNSLEQDNLIVLSDLYDGLFSQIESQINNKLFSLSEQKRYYCEFERRALFAADPAQIRLIIDQFNNRLLSWEECRQLINRNTDRDDGTYVDDFKSSEQPEQETSPVTAPEQPEQAPPEQAPEQEQPTTRESALLEVNLKRIKNRIQKSVDAGKYDLTNHLDVIRDNLPMTDEETIEDELYKLQAELEAVLPEQRKGIIEQWDIAKFATKL